MRKIINNVRRNYIVKFFLCGLHLKALVIQCIKFVWFCCFVANWLKVALGEGWGSLCGIK